MVLIHDQDFYNRKTNERHNIRIGFGWISPVSNGTYRVFMDDVVQAEVKTKRMAFDKAVELIKDNNLTDIKRF